MVDALSEELTDDEVERRRGRTGRRRARPAERAWTSFHLGAAFEGLPGLIHGGISAMILDQMRGEAAGAGGRPGVIGTLTLRYRRGAPLGDLRAEAWIERSEGTTTWARHLADAAGVTVEAEGLFILPRWARAADGREPDVLRVATRPAARPGRRAGRRR